MTLLKSAIAALALLGCGAMATATPIPGNGGPLPSVRKQIMQQAKSAGILAGLKSPSLRIKYSDGGKVATATLFSLSNFGGGPKPLVHPERLSAADAKFSIGQVVEGRIAAPVKQDGQVWQRIDRGIALTK